MEAVPGRSNDLLSGEKRCNIAAREAPRAEGFEPSVVPCVVSTHLPSPDGSEVYLCMPKMFSAYERSSLCEAAVSSRVGHLFNPEAMNGKSKPGRPRLADPRTHRYNFKLNEEENIRFCRMLAEAGLEHNRSRFIVKRIFAEEFVVVRRDPSTVQFVTRLNDFYFQFQRVAQNYNQVVKAINAHFSNVAIPHQIAVLEQRTRELKALSIEILNLVKKAAQ